MIRDFVLSNMDGQSLDLLDTNMFGYDPEGLGLSLEHTLIAQGASFAEIATNVAAATFKVKLLVGATELTGYKAYKVLADFLHYGPFTLEYSTDAGTYKRDCVLDNVTKTEITQGLTALDEELNMSFTSPWYEEITLTSKPGGGGSGKIGFYGMIYVNEIINLSPRTILYGGSYYAQAPKAKYPIYYSGLAAHYGIIEVTNNSLNTLSEGSPVKVVIEGVSDNPYWEVGVKSQVVASDGYTVKTGEADTIEVSSYPNDQKAEWTTSGGMVNNLYLSQDITKDGFIRVPPGQSTIAFYNTEGEVKITYREERLLV